VGHQRYPIKGFY